MFKRLLIGLVALAVVAAGLFYWLGSRKKQEESGWRMVDVVKADITATVGATGTLGATRTVEVGTQVSGQIVELLADFNDHVKKGQLIARLDDTMLQQAAVQAEAELQRASSDLDYKQYLLEQSESLARSGSLSDTDLRSARLALSQAKAALSSAGAGLDRARRNLEYTKITAPVSGIIIDRKVDVGQTVAASLSAPQLFLIAEDLTRMQILTSVDESDIGRIQLQQPAEFTVQAWADKKFKGQVSQIRLQPTSTENVVNYTVVVDVENADLQLMPGMTATVDFIVDKASQVLAVPNAALRFKPSEELLAELRAARQKARAEKGADSAATTQQDSGSGVTRKRSVSAAGGDPHGAASIAGSRSTTARKPGAAVLWVLGENQKPRPLRITTGLSDGQQTQVTGEGLSEGLQVIAGQISGEAGSGAAKSPFQTTQSGGMSGPPRGGM
ncbi:MAG: efflux RND transporter periplasmic adaptor subunit [Candidatus Delongbacteria bacterium]